MDEAPVEEKSGGPEPPRRVVTFGEAFRFWLKLGFISFGGPAGQIAIMHRELVERRRWLSEERFLHALNYCMLLPGPEAQQLATYIGWLLHRARGGLVAGALFIIPGIFVLLALSYVYVLYGNVRGVAAALEGVKPVVVAIVLEAVVRIGKRSLRGWPQLLIAAMALVSVYFFRLAFPAIVLLAGLLGLLAGRVWPGSVAGRRSAGGAAAGGGARPSSPDTAIADQGPPPAHTLPSRARALRILGIGLLLWALPFLGVIGLRGWQSLHSEEYRFFSLAAVVTFGGAYAVLAYATQVVVDSYGWLTHAEAMDGLALAETTPGPLIMVLQFIGFIAAWKQPEGMSPAGSATLGALITTWTTFLPSFLFVLIGGPYIENLRQDRRLASALSGVSAAVVGVILNLFLFFGAAVLWRPGEGVDWFALALAVAAFVALHRFKVGVAWVVLAGGAIGALRAAFLG